MGFASLYPSYGLRHIPEGFRRLPGVANELANLVEDGTATSQGDSKSPPGFFNRLAAQLWLVGTTRHPAS